MFFRVAEIYPFFSRHKLRLQMCQVWKESLGQIRKISIKCKEGPCHVLKGTATNKDATTQGTLWVLLMTTGSVNQGHLEQLSTYYGTGRSSTLHFCLQIFICIFKKWLRTLFWAGCPKTEISMLVIVPGKPKVAPLVAYWENGVGLNWNLIPW
jgi:hypothetical protein